MRKHCSFHGHDGPGRPPGAVRCAMTTPCLFWHVTRDKGVEGRWRDVQNLNITEHLDYSPIWQAPIFRRLRNIGEPSGPFAVCDDPGP